MKITAEKFKLVTYKSCNKISLREVRGVSKFSHFTPYTNVKHFRDPTLVPLDQSFQIDLGTDNWICCQATGRLKPGEFVLKVAKGYMSRGHFF